MTKWSPPKAGFDFQAIRKCLKRCVRHSAPNLKRCFMTISTLTFAAFLASAQLVSIDARDIDLSDFFRFMADAAKVNIVIHPAVQGKVNLTVRDAPWEQLLDLVMKNYGLGKEVEGNVMRIAPIAAFEAEYKQRAAT